VPPNTGSVISSDPRAAAQAKSIGATIGGDGWWYKDGKKLSTKEADRLTNEAGTAITSTDTAHGERARDIWGRGSDFVSKGWKNSGLDKVKIGGWVGDTYERNKGDILAAAGTVASGGNPLVGAAIKAGMQGAKRGATGGDAIKGGVSGYMLGSGVSGAMGGFANAGVAGTSKLAGAAKGFINPNLTDFTGKGTKAATAAYKSAKQAGTLGTQVAAKLAAPVASVAEGAAQAASQAAPPPNLSIPDFKIPDVPLPSIDSAVARFTNNPLVGKTPVPNIFTKPLIAGKSLKDIWGFATDDKNKDMLRAGADYFSGATKQKGQMAEQDFESGKQRMEYNKGMIAAQKQDFDAIELEKRRKQQMGEMLMKMLGAGFFANKGGSYEPPR